MFYFLKLIFYFRIFDSYPTPQRIGWTKTSEERKANPEHLCRSVFLVSNITVPPWGSRLDTGLFLYSFNKYLLGTAVGAMDCHFGKSGKASDKRGNYSKFLEEGAWREHKEAETEWTMGKGVGAEVAKRSRARPQKVWKFSCGARYLGAPSTIRLIISVTQLLSSLTWDNNTSLTRMLWG